MNRRRFIKHSVTGSVLAGSSLSTFPGSSQAVSEDADQERRIKENETIQGARRVALDELKPSGKELEHGLELHRDSIVFDAYGFSPRASLDGARIRAAIERGASEIELQDLREEMMMTRAVTDPFERQEYLDAWHASGVTCQFQNAGEEGQDPLRLIKRLARFTFVTDFLEERVGRAVAPADVIAAKEAGKHCLYFSGNGVPLTQQWVSVEDELRYIRVFFQLGIRMMHLTYNRRNMIGDGCAEPANAGLSDFGRQVVAEMNRVGVIPDVAHSGWKTSLEAAGASTRPIVASHSGAVAVHEHIRCKPDEVIRAIAESGGYVGICCVPSFLGGGILALLDHVEYIARKFGAEHVSIGTDYGYASRRSSAENSKIPSTGPSRTRWASFWPPGALDSTPEDRETMAWTNWPLFTVGLVQRGFSDGEIKKILGENVLRVAEASLPLMDLPG